MSSAPIYLDHNATTPTDPRVVEAMVRAWRECPGNPASQHAAGRQSRRMLEEAREGILDLLGAKTGGMDADQLIFTSGGTEANNLALLGYSQDETHADLMISPFEHPSVRAVADAASKRGWNVHVLPWGDAFRRHLEVVENNDGVFLISYMLANNETGIVHPLPEIVSTCSAYGPYFHTDAVQAVGKIPVNFRALNVDAMTVAPHKFHGPLGIGALILHHTVKLHPLQLGGFQQAGLRPGTESVALAVGFHEALRLATAELPERATRMQALRDDFESRLKGELNNVVIIGEHLSRLPNTSCLAFPGLDRQALVMALDLAGVACSSGSACASGSSEPSPALVAMGLEKEIVNSAVRFSLGAFTTPAEATLAAERILKVVQHLRRQK